MKIRKRIEMAVESERVLTVRMSAETHRECCETCNSHAPMLTITEAAQFAQISSRTIFHLIEAGQLHFRETAGLLLVCFHSLSAAKGKITTS